MTDQQIANPKVHDMGGEPGGGPIDKAEHEVTFWEQRVDAMLVLLGDKKRRIMDTAELRRGIESLGPEAYDRLSYYERWAASIASTVIEKGIVTQAEIDQRVAEIRARKADGK
jgi:hypothetical protein